MSPPPRHPAPHPPLGPERLAELLDDAVRHVTAQPGALDRIRHGVRRRRTARRSGAILLAVAVLAGGGSTALALTSAHGPADLATSAGAPGEQRATAAATMADAQDGQALLPPPAYPAPSAADSAARAAYPSVAQPASWDLDGDGRPDTATIMAVGNARTTSSFQLVVHLTRLGVQAVSFTAASVAAMPPRGPVIIGPADAAHDGHAELFVQVDAGCCTEFWTIFRLVNGRVRQMTISGEPVRLPVGGSALDNGGFSCAGADLAVYAYQPGATADTFLATRDTYRWSGAELILASQQQTTIHALPASPALAPYTGVTCGTLPQYEPLR